MKDFRIDYVELPSGNVPFEAFLEDLTIKERTEVFALIEVVKSKMNNSERIPTNISKHLDSGIFELRVKHLNRISRTLYFFQIGELLIITHGFIKKTSAVPSKEIEKAKKYRKIYIEANNAN